MVLQQLIIHMQKKPSKWIIILNINHKTMYFLKENMRKSSQPRVRKSVLKHGTKHGDRLVSIHVKIHRTLQQL